MASPGVVHEPLLQVVCVLGTYMHHQQDVQARSISCARVLYVYLRFVVGVLAGKHDLRATNGRIQVVAVLAQYLHLRHGRSIEVLAPLYFLGYAR